MNVDYWAWGGKYIGFRSGNNLFSKKGTPIGYFMNDYLFSFSGKYLAEIKNSNRLIIVLSHKGSISSSYVKPCNSCGRSCCDCIGNIMISGCEDFSFDN